MAGKQDDTQLPGVKPMPVPPDSRVIGLDRQAPLTHQQVEAVRFGLGDTGPLAQAVMNSNVAAATKQIFNAGVSCLSDRRPADPVVGQMIWETDTKSVYFWDGSSWVTPVNTTPVATIHAYGGVNVPSGWLLCGGQTVSNVTYPALFSAITTAFTGATTTNLSATVSGLSNMSAAEHVGWGITGNGIPSGATITAVGGATSVTISANATVTQTGTASLWIGPYRFTGANNTTNFLIPDLRGRVPFGKDNMDTASVPARITNTGTDNSGILGTSLGASGGDQRMHLHTHTQNAHSHGIDVRNVDVVAGNASVQGNAAGATWGGIGGINSTTASNQNTGTGTAQNMPPAIIANYIIKT